MAGQKDSRKKSTFPLTSLNEQLLAFMRIGSAMLEAQTLDEILGAITREVSRVIDFDRSSVAMLSPDKKSLVLCNIHKGGETQKFGEGRTIPLEESNVIGWVATHRRPLLRNLIDGSDEFEEIVSEEPLASDIVVPLLAREEVLGTLNVGSYHPNAFTDTDLEVLDNCAKFASLAIEHTRLRLDAQDLLERYKTLQRNANDIIMLVDKNTAKLVEANRKFESVFGYMPEEVPGKSYFDLFAEEDAYQARRDFIKVLSEKAMTFLDRRMITRDGSLVYVDINANLINLKDDTFIQVIVHNVSQRKMLEQQIIVQNRNLQKVNKKLTQMDQMKTEFLANISHELRTPLSIIIAYAESLRDPALSDEERLGFLDVIRENGANLLALINNLLELSKLEMSGHKLNMSLSHVHDVINSVWPQMDKLARAKGLAMRFDPDDHVPVAYFDNSQVKQVVQCLIQNAIKFTESGGSVAVKTSADGSDLRVQVVDTGMGIRDDELESIFETFHQVDGSSSRKWGGLGIGLAIAKHIIELHKGQLLVESEFGSGSTFTIVLPLDTEEVFLMESTPPPSITVE